MKRIIKVAFIITAIIAIASSLIVAFFPEKIIPVFITQQINKRGNPDSGYLEEKEIITVVTVGTGSPLPGKRAQTGTAVFVNGYFFMFDVGAGVVQNSESFKLPLDQLNAVFITHYHSDHVMDLPNLINRSWVLGRTNPLEVYGPTGLDNIIQAIDQFSFMENQYRVDHHGAGIMDIDKAKGISNEFENIQNSSEVVFQQDGITITAFDVDHEPVEPAVGYSIEYNGKKVVLSGDTKQNDLLKKISKDADLLIHEVMLMSLLDEVEEELSKVERLRDAKIMHDVQDYHTSPSEVAELANAANVSRLVLNHLAPTPDNAIIKRLYMKELKAYKGPIHLANDGDVFIIN